MSNDSCEALVEGVGLLLSSHSRFRFSFELKLGLRFISTNRVTGQLSHPMNTLGGREEVRALTHREAASWKGGGREEEWRWGGVGKSM